MQECLYKNEKRERERENSVEGKGASSITYADTPELSGNTIFRCNLNTGAATRFGDSKVGAAAGTACAFACAEWARAS